MLVGCQATPEEATLFRKLPAGETGIAFVNRLPEDSSFNFISYMYYYNGAGVAVGDVDSDGLMDLYFTSNLGSNRLYLNRGHLRFEDVTEKAGVGGTGSWKTGVTMADVNADGRVDIYVSEVSGYLDLKGRNQLFINNGDGTFTDRAKAYGLDVAALGTHASFFDYDGDGDLDVYLLNHSVHSLGTFGPADLRYERNPLAGDRLMRNDGGRFVDVSEQAGIYGGVVGYGLSATVSDLNLDGCPDIYVANDFHENDYLYLNNCDGTFRESIRDAMGHTSRYSMGSDAADVNNDGRPDLAVLDMLPDRQDILRTSETGESYDLYAAKVRLGYHDQLTRNTLQLNVGHGRFSDVALLAGVQATDWSWAPLLADYDNDGHNDLFVTNGIYHRPNDLDYMSFSTEAGRREAMRKSRTLSDAELIAQMPHVPIPNYAFRNDGDLTFTNVSTAWGLDDTSFSNGAAYADLDNDGDLDLVTNNINEPSSVFENRAETLHKDAHFLTVALEGTGGNTAGIGAKVFVRQHGKLLFREQIPARGFESSVDPRLHFGLGADSTADSLTVVWPDARFQVLTDVSADTILTLHQADAAGAFIYDTGPPAHPLFIDVTDSIHLGFRHVENAFDDFTRQPLLPHMISREGPALAVGDVNGDGLDDVFLGGAKYEAGQILLQTRTGGFVPLDEPALRADSLAEDVCAALFDADGDTDLDLVV
ncbi:MAG TPA: VCBS repeat-containing protein, partial [Rhodothermales bacterium]|nr:VCBS repeat-containing protein [Rhodothermales bacterium]